MIFIALHWDESADEMLSALLGDGVELGPLKRLIIEKTEGNPFFMEETLLVLLDEGGAGVQRRGQAYGCNPNYISRWKGRFEAERLAVLYSHHPDERWRNEPGAGGQDAGVDPQTSAGWF